MGVKFMMPRLLSISIVAGEIGKDETSGRSSGSTSHVSASRPARGARGARRSSEYCDFIGASVSSTIASASSYVVEATTTRREAALRVAMPPAPRPRAAE
jgi:hypothetical protein